MNSTNEATQSGPIDPSPSAERPEFAWEEIGFAEFPVVTTSLRRPPFDTLEFTDQIGVDAQGEPIYRTWQMVGSAEYGLPRLSDLDVFIAIVKLLERYNFERRLVPCSARDICEIAGLARGGETHRRIRNAFVRFQTTSYIARNHFIDPRTHERILSEGWDIITDHRIVQDPTHMPDRDGLPASYFAVGHAFLSRLRHGQLKPLDLGLWRELPLGLAKPIFHYLDKNLYHKGRHEVGLRKFSQRIGLTGRYDLAQLKRLCRKPLDILVGKGFLDEFRYEASKSPTDPIKLVVTPGSRARRRVIEARDLSVHRSPEHASESRTAPNSAAPSGHPHDLVRFFREVFHETSTGPVGIREAAAAAKLLEHCQGDFVMAKSCITWIRGRASWIENFAGLLSNNYPERAIAALSGERAARTDDDTRRERGRLESRFQEWRRAEIGRRFEALDTAAREELLSQALEDLRTRPDGRSFSALAGEVQQRMAELKVRAHLGRDLPSLEEWAARSSAAGTGLLS